jgi:hypothetical protein
MHGITLNEPSFDSMAGANQAVVITNPGRNRESGTMANNSRMEKQWIADEET